MNSNRTSKERAQKTAKGRCSDQNYYLSKNLSAKYIELSPNPTFTEEDRQKKMEIFGVPDLKTCFITEQPSKGVGDHFKEINGYYAKTGMRGIDDEWNILPVSGSQNKSYKIMEYVIDGKKIKKNIGYESISDDELLYLASSENEKYIQYYDIYVKVWNWERYVENRGAKMWYKEPELFKNIRNIFKQKYIDDLWIPIFELINQITSISDPPSEPPSEPPLPPPPPPSDLSSDA